MDNGPSRFYDGCSTGSPLDSLLDCINNGDYNNVAYHCRVTNIDCSLWFEATRNRVYIFLVRSDLGDLVLNDAVA